MYGNIYPNVITLKKVKHRLENNELEDYSKQDAFERYIVYGSKEELNNLSIQGLLIKHGYIVEELTALADYRGYRKSDFKYNKDSYKCSKGKI